MSRCAQRWIRETRRALTARAGPARAAPWYLTHASELLFSPAVCDVALQGGPRPHPPAVARGHRATSPVRAETLFHLAFSGIAASPPSTAEQPEEGSSDVAENCDRASLDAVPLLQVLHWDPSSLPTDSAVLAPGLLGAPSESVQVRGVVHPAHGHLGAISLPSGSP